MVWILQNISKKESLLLGLLGISLTTAGATLLYEFCRKNNDGIYVRKRKSISKITSVEFKVPNSTVATVIGKGGYTIREIEMKTGVTIKVQQPNRCTKSNSQERICVISGSEEGVKLAKIIIQNIIETVPVIDSYEFYVPYRTMKHILGTGRQTLLEIQEASNAKIIIDDSDLDYKSASHPANYSYGDPSKDGKKRIIVHGTIRQIEIALRLIEDKVRLEDGVGTALQDLRRIKVPGTCSKMLTDEVPDDPNNIEFIMPPVLADDAMEVYISAMETPSHFWIQIVGPGMIYLESLTNQMSMYYDNKVNQEMYTLKEISVGQLVAARCKYYDQWYRAEVIKILSNEYEVFLLDYGNSLRCYKKDVLKLCTDMMSLRLQAIECKLANVKPKGGEWSLDSLRHFASSTWIGQSKIMDAAVKGYIERPDKYKRSYRESAVILSIELHDRHENLTLGQSLINAGYAEYEEDIHSRMTDVVANIMKHQFLSVRPLSKSECLTAHAEKGGMNENKSVPCQSMLNSIASQPKESNKPVKITNVVTSSVEKHGDAEPNKAEIATFGTNEAEMSTLNADKNDEKPDESVEHNVKPDEADRNDPKPDKSEPKSLSIDNKDELGSFGTNEAEISILNADKNDEKPDEFVEHDVKPDEADRNDPKPDKSEPKSLSIDNKDELDSN